eukprot:6458809-Amphidinium_carterae.1
MTCGMRQLGKKKRKQVVRARVSQQLAPGSRLFCLSNATSGRASKMSYHMNKKLLHYLTLYRSLCYVKLVRLC